MNKKYVAIIAVVVVAVIAIMVVALVVLPGLFTPPADISGINPSTSLATDELLPSTLADKDLTAGSVDTVNATVTTDTRSFEVEHTSAEYNGVTVHIIRHNPNQMLQTHLTFYSMTMIGMEAHPHTPRQMIGLPPVKAAEAHSSGNQADGFSVSTRKITIL